MNVEAGTDASQFLFWTYLFQIFRFVSLQCMKEITGISSDGGLDECRRQIYKMGKVLHIPPPSLLVYTPFMSKFTRISKPFSPSVNYVIPSVFVPV